MNTNLKRAVLLALKHWDLPMPEASLITSAQLIVRPSTPTDGDIRDAIKECQREKYIEGVTDAFSQEITWSLTTLGIHQARKL